MKQNSKILLLLSLPLLFSLQIRSKVTTKLTSSEEVPATEAAKRPTDDAAIKSNPAVPIPI
jgi:hypothetical protein